MSETYQSQPESVSQSQSQQKSVKIRNALPNSASHSEEIGVSQGLPESDRVDQIQSKAVKIFLVAVKVSQSQQQPARESKSHTNLLKVNCFAQS